MVQYLEKYKQNIAIEMRKQGLSYSEIENRLHVPKSTLSFWLKKIKLTMEQIKKLNDRRVETAKANALKKTSKTLRMIEEIKSVSSLDIKKISKKELWLGGIVLYWKNRNKSDLKKGVYFSSSDPHMIKLFLKWLKEVGGVGDDEIRFDIFTGRNKKNSAEKIADYWSKVAGFPKSYFRHIYFQKSKSNGFLRVKVVQSSMLARQIAGWIEGLKKINNL